MKTTVAFVVGCVVGLSIAALAFLAFRQETEDAKQAKSASQEVAHVPEQNVRAQPGAVTISDRAANEAAHMESALRELQEAGMAVLPLELLAHYRQPQLFSPATNPKLVEAFRLDAREWGAMSAARIRYMTDAAKALERNLGSTEMDGDVLVVKASIPEPARKSLVSALRNDVFNNLDEESASLVSYLNFDQLASTLPIPNQLALRVRHTETPGKYLVTVIEGSRRNDHFMNASELLAQYPTLDGKLPPPKK